MAPRPYPAPSASTRYARVYSRTAPQVLVEITSLKLIRSTGRRRWNVRRGGKVSYREWRTIACGPAAVMGAVVIAVLCEDFFMRQLQLFTSSELATMRDRTASRNCSAVRDEFRKVQQERRYWGKRRGHIERLRRECGYSHVEAVEAVDGVRRRPAPARGHAPTGPRMPSPDRTLSASRAPAREREPRTPQTLSPDHGPSAPQTPSPGHAPSAPQTPPPGHAPSAPQTPPPGHAPSAPQTPPPGHAPSAPRTPLPDHAQRAAGTRTPAMPQTPCLTARSARRRRPYATVGQASGRIPRAASPASHCVVVVVGRARRGQAPCSPVAGRVPPPVRVIRRLLPRPIRSRPDLCFRVAPTSSTDRR
ncbi:hypothetical protein J2S44_006450 [Catenuloplanes niger]|uniref:Uncharacterized protein n=1 Tax=Catenuloplanes niger TaxID=587534 RepID=A0AAE4CVG4_9ACTN|nr:hypothetical protein [Catenuloplanes niger]